MSDDYDDIGDEPTQAARIVALAQDATYFHDADLTPYISFAVDQHVETHPLESKHAKYWLSHLYYKAEGQPPNTQVFADAKNILAAKAIYDGEQRKTHVRIAPDGPNIYLDLGNDDWTGVLISTEGWQPVARPPVMFRRRSGQLALPMPQAGGNIDELREFVNIDDESWPLLLGTLVMMFRPVGPYPVLVLTGPQGAAKSSTARVIRDLVDPNLAGLRAEARNEHELVITAKNGWLLVFDNLSRLTPQMSDALCRLATGGGFAVRKLFSNDDEVLFDAQRPAVLTSIGDVATRADLLDRAVLLPLPAITPERRRPQKELEEKFEAARPRLLGAILDGVVGALRALPDTHIADPPRLADFAIFATAAETALGLTKGDFMSAYRSNREYASAVALDASPLTSVIPILLARSTDGTWTGTATELLEALTPLVGDTVARSRAWPTSGQTMSNQLRSIEPNLEAQGIGFDPYREPGTGRRLIRLTSAATSPSE